MVNVIFPYYYRVEYSELRQHLNKAHLAWWVEWKNQQPDFPIENVRFNHTPGWDKRFFSIQSAHDGSHWVWKATKVFWVGAGGTL